MMKATGAKKDDHDDEGDRRQKGKYGTEAAGNQGKGEHHVNHLPGRNDKKADEDADDDPGIKTVDKSIHEDSENPDGTQNILPSRELCRYPLPARHLLSVHKTPCIRSRYFL